jgi:hypothetical protein
VGAIKQDGKRRQQDDANRKDAELTARGTHLHIATGDVIEPA